MGFFSGLAGIFGGGGQSKESSSGQSGFALLPSQIQDAYKNYATELSGQIPNATTAYTPLAQTADETQAFNNIRRGFTPTQESLGQDISMLMNPFNDAVIQNLNRQAQSDFSILKQNASQAGQFGSNRQMLGANDIENSRQGMIGSLLQNQYNQAIGQVFNNLIPQRQQDTQGLLGIGDFQRNLATQTNAAPITGLQQIGSALSVLPQSGGSVQSSQGSSFNSNGGILNSILGMAGGGLLGYAKSDRRLKENIEFLHKENGHNVYEFSYIGNPKRFIGVMAQEVEKIIPEAVIEISGFKAVNYDKLGITFREVA